MILCCSQEHCDPKYGQGEDVSAQDLTPEFARLLRLSSGVRE